MKISLIQIDSGEDKEVNFKKAQKHILEAMTQKPDIICLPENFLYRGDDAVKEAEKLFSDYISAFQKLAKTQKVNLILGSIALTTETEKNKKPKFIINKKNLSHYNLSRPSGKIATKLK